MRARKRKCPNKGHSSVNESMWSHSGVVARPRTRMFALLLYAAAAIVRIEETTVTTRVGEVVGMVDETRVVAAFKGVPFAEPPIGPRRFRDPVAVAPRGTIDARRYKPQCMQECTLPIGFCAAEMSEDCLYLNVHTPLDAINGNRSLPVVVFLPGGAFLDGSAMAPIYDGSPLVASHPHIVYVAANYRLGAFGFLNDGASAHSGNMGLKDQLMALEWVQTHIDRFGGDPTRVTLMGESAGAMSIALHMTSTAPPPFSRVIMQSNPFAIQYRTRQHDLLNSVKFLAKLKCPSFYGPCMQSKSSQELLRDSESTRTVSFPLSTDLINWAPHLDGVIWKQQPLEAFRSGSFRDVPMLVGTNKDEFALFFAEVGRSKIGLVTYSSMILGLFGRHAVELERLYPGKLGSNFEQAVQLFTDYMFTCPMQQVVREFNSPVYMYSFQQHLSFNPWSSTLERCATRACHGVELPYLFNTIDSADIEHPNYTFTQDEAALSARMQHTWTQFIHNGTTTWQPYDSSGSVHILTAKTHGERNEPHSHRRQCATWDRIGYQNHWR